MTGNRPNGVGPSGFAGALRWAFVMNWGREGTSALVTLLLALILGPEAFGVVAMAMVFIAFLELFVEQGMISALIHRHELDRNTLDTAFWIVTAAAVIVATLSFLAGDAWAAFNRTPELGPVIHFLSLALVLQGLGIVQHAYLQKKMDFRSLAIRTNAGVLVGAVVGFGLALSGAGVWALVAQRLSMSLVELVLLWAFSPWRPRLFFCRKRARELYGYASRVFANGLGVATHRRSDALIVGYFFGPVAVALYRVGERLAQLVVELTTRPIAQVSLPEFANRRRDPNALRESVLRSVSVSTGLAIPALCGLGAVGAVLVELMGPAWSGTAPVLLVFCALGIVRSLTLITGPLLQAAARPGLMALMTWALATLNLLGFLIAAAWLAGMDVSLQALGIALVRYGVFALLYAPVNLVLLLRLSGNTPAGLLRCVLPGVLGGLAAAAAAAGAELALRGSGLPTAGRLALMVLAGAAAGLALLGWLQPTLGNTFARITQQLRKADR